MLFRSFTVKFVSYSPYGQNKFGIFGIILNLLSQSSDMNHDIIVIKGIFVLPDRTINLLFGKDPSRILRKKHKQIKLLRRQIKRHAVLTHPVPGLINLPAVTHFFEISAVLNTVYLLKREDTLARNSLPEKGFVR